MFNRVVVIIAGLIAGFFGWVAATAVMAFLLQVILWRDLSWDYAGNLNLILVFPAAVMTMPSWILVSPFVYGKLRRKTHPN
jgi:hypothetical protein